MPFKLKKKKKPTASQNKPTAQSASKRKDFYTVAELAIRWNLSERHIRRQIASGELTCDQTSLPSNSGRPVAGTRSIPVACCPAACGTIR